MDAHVTSLDPSTFNWTLPMLMRLRPCFASWGSMELHGCDVGHNGQSMLAAIAKAVRVPVTAALHHQIGQGREMWAFGGPTVTEFPDGGSLKTWSEAAVMGTL